MAAPMDAQRFPIRIKLLFDFPPPGAPTERRLWFIVDMDRCRLVADLQSDIRQRFHISSRTAVTLFIDGCLAPAAERITLVRDGDCIRVQQVAIIDVNDPGFYGAARNQESQTCLDSMTEVEGTITEPEMLFRRHDALNPGRQEKPLQKKKSKKMHQNDSFEPKKNKRKRTHDTNIMQPHTPKDGINDTVGIAVSKKKKIERKPRISGSEGMPLKNTHVSRSNVRALKNKRHEQCDNNRETPSKRKGEQIKRGSKKTKTLHKRLDESNPKLKSHKEDSHDDDDEDNDASVSVHKAVPCSSSSSIDDDDGDDPVNDALTQKSKPLHESIEGRVGNDAAEEGVTVSSVAIKLGNAARKGPMAIGEDSKKLNKSKISSSSESSSSTSDESPVSKDQVASARNPKAQTAVPLNRGRDMMPRGRGIPLALSNLSLSGKGRGKNLGAGALMHPVGRGTAQTGGHGSLPGCNSEGGGLESPSLGRTGQGLNRSVRGGHVAAVPKHTFLNASEKYDSEERPTVPVTSETASVTANSQVLKLSPVRDYTTLASLNGTPRAGDNIAFKMLEMGDNYSPEVSKYKEGKVLDYNQVTCETVILLTKNPSAGKRANGKFDLVFETENGKKKGDDGEWEYFSKNQEDDKVQQLAGFLDPQGVGRVSFNHFCRGISAMKAGGERGILEHFCGQEELRKDFESEGSDYGFHGSENLLTEGEAGTDRVDGEEEQDYEEEFSSSNTNVKHSAILATMSQSSVPGLAILAADLMNTSPKVSTYVSAPDSGTSTTDPHSECRLDLDFRLDAPFVVMDEQHVSQRSGDDGVEGGNAAGDIDAGDCPALGLCEEDGERTSLGLGLGADGSGLAEVGLVSDCTSGVGSEDRESGFSSPRLCERWKGTPRHGTTGLLCAEPGEEQFEDYGESTESEFASGQPELDRSPHEREFLEEHVASLPSSPSHSSHHWLGLLPRGPVAFTSYCSQCSRRIDILRQLESRLQQLEIQSPNCHISTATIARQLLHTSNLSSRSESTEEIFPGLSEFTQPDIADKLSYLEQRVAVLEQETAEGSNLHGRLKQENLHLVHRIHALEEQLKDQEVRAEERVEEDSKRHREQVARLCRERTVEVETLTARLFMLEEENEQFRMTMPRLKAQVEKLEEEKTRLQEKLEDFFLRIKDEMDLSKKLTDKMKRDRHEVQKEREATQELIEDLRKQLEYLQMFRLEVERGGRGRGPGAGLQEYTARTRESELEQEVRRLRQDNRRLRDSNEELNGQIISVSLHEAKNLFSAAAKSHSLAAEIDSVSRDELMTALKELEDINFHLRQYMDKIILAILDHNPSILEIKS
uniref:FIP-RBD domain-containing protein n=1 Tax=Eptatretus burgeri TaxID=7764 RepID=A0A8C4QLQ3_EPTBU